MALEDYNAFDRAVHALAFGPQTPRRMLCDMEKSALGERIAAVSLGAPIFVTALPRAGTTLMLELLADHPDTVSHTYRDMPFVRSPAIWNRLARGFQANSAAKERSHGDGIMVSADSPEAFDEVLWLDAFPAHYRKSSILPWYTPLPTPFITRFVRHMRSVAAAREAQASPVRELQTEPKRYLSKNNANIARIDALAKAFPDAAILVPLRDPLQHAASMLRQHEKALASHGQSAFAARYVRDIGHFEFGAAHRPIAFAGFAELAEPYHPRSLDYWLAYWVCAYRHVARAQACTIIDMARLTQTRSIATLLSAARLRPDSALETAAAERLRAMPKHAARPSQSALVDEAYRLHRRLAARALH